jgi:nitronate monooxygenase
MFSDRRILDLFGIELPIIQAPMAGSSGPELAIAVAEAGGLGSLPGALLSHDDLRTQIGIVRQRTSKPFNVNFFCYVPPKHDTDREAVWRKRLAPYYAEFGLSEPEAGGPPRMRVDEAACDLVVETKPAVVSFHFGVPERRLLGRVKHSGAMVIASATTVNEARFLEGEGCDAIIAQGYEAGGHRGMFLSASLESQMGTFALVPQVADAVGVPVIAAGGIGDARGIVAALALGASAVQIGTAYLRCPESIIGRLHREALAAPDSETAVTNVFTGRPARSIVNLLVREVGPISDAAPPFPLAGAAVAPLRMHAESTGSSAFTPLWSGQAAGLAREVPAGELTTRLASEAAELLGRLTRGAS